MSIWNPWHGCHKKSAGCLNCYMFRRDSEYEKDSTIVTKTNSFDLIVKARTFFLENFGMMDEGRGNGGRASRY